MQNFIKNGSYINGQFLNEGEQFNVQNPATLAVIATIHDAGKEGAGMAVEAASFAFGQWKSLTAYQRAEILLRWYQLIMDNQEALAQLLTAEQGKPLSEARGEIAYSASFIQWFAEEAKRAYGDVIPNSHNNQRLLVLKQPVGVVAAITPWNFPSAMLVRKAAAALAAGCTFVGRPDTQTPLSALALAALAEKAGVPAGVFNVVVAQHAQEVGELLTTHADIAKVTFTGSTRVGKLLLKQSSESVKRVSMELGGNAPFIVFDDADIDNAVASAIAAKYRNAGQTCICVNRILVDKKVVDQFTAKYVDAVSKLKVGNGIEQDVVIGPLISSQAVARVQKLLDESIAMGAEVIYKGENQSDNAHFFSPVVVTNVTAGMPVAKEEIFGPVSAIMTFEEEAEAITLANQTEYGLAAYFFSNNINRIWRVSEALDYGMLGINDSAISNAAAPFGGVKHSGFGREGSKYGLSEYQSTKYLCIGNIT